MLQSAWIANISLNDISWCWQSSIKSCYSIAVNQIKVWKIKLKNTVLKLILLSEALNNLNTQLHTTFLFHNDSWLNNCKSEEVPLGATLLSIMRQNQISNPILVTWRYYIFYTMVVYCRILQCLMIKIKKQQISIICKFTGVNHSKAWLFRREV